MVNRSDKGSEISLDDIEKTVGLKIGHVFPNDYRHAVGAINKGQPMAESTQGRLAESFHALPITDWPDGSGDRSRRGEQFLGVVDSEAVALKLGRESSTEWILPLALRQPLAVDTRRSDYQELKSRIHQALLDGLDLDRLAYVKREDAEPEIRTLIAVMLDRESENDAAQPVRARGLVTDAQRALRERSARRLASRDPAISDIPDQPLRPGLHRTQRHARADRASCSGRPPSAGIIRAYRQRRWPPNRRVESDGRCQVCRRFTRQRHHSAYRPRWTCRFDPPVPHRGDLARRISSNAVR